MSEEDRKYLRSVKKMTPSFEVFKQMVQIMKNVQQQTDNLLKASLSVKV